MRLAVALFGISAAAIALVWAWLGAPVAVPSGGMTAGEKLYCVSYAPFRGGQTPLDLQTHVTAAQIEDDLARLSKLTGCVRTYSVDFGLDQIPEIAQRHGLKVILGLWLSSHADKNRYQIESAVALANKFPDVIRALVVGNEVLLRGEMSPADLAATLRAVKQQVKVPVTYADVWEFWLRNPALAGVADFITIHILPYWEDFPIAAEHAAAHVDATRRRVAAAFPGKEVLIGEVGWPSAGRMREGALPSPVNQARVIEGVLAQSKRENYRVNVIEAFDQPWKRALEGTVGGHWGLLDDATRAPKFSWGVPVSDHPNWPWQAAGGILFAALVFGAALYQRSRTLSARIWIAVAVCAVAGGILTGWTIENIPLESLGIGGWAHSLAIAAVAMAAPMLVGAAIASGTAIPSFAEIIGPAASRVREPLSRAVGVILIATVVLAIMVALGLVFDPRYRDFPFAPLSAAALPYLAHRFTFGWSGRGASETACAIILVVAALYIAINETLANWQSLWLCTALGVLALTLVRPRAARN